MTTLPPDPPEVLERFHQHLYLCSIQASRFRTYGPRDELLSLAQEGLLIAARRYEPERGIPFSGYASFRIRGAILDGMRRSGKMPRRLYQQLRAGVAALELSKKGYEELCTTPPTPGEDPQQVLHNHMASMATAMAMGLVNKRLLGKGDSFDYYREEPFTDEYVGTMQLIHKLRGYLDNLDETDQAIIRRHYFEGENFDQIALDLGISKSWLSRIHKKLIQRLTKRFQEEGLARKK